MLYGEVQSSPSKSGLAGQLTVGARIGALVGVVTPVELLEVFSAMQRSSACDPYALLYVEYVARPSGSTRTN